LNHAVTVLRETPRGVGQAAQAASLTVGSEDHLALLVDLAVGPRVYAAAAPALVAAIALLAVAGQAIADKMLAAAVATG
jgi:hypothetical protein